MTEASLLAVDLIFRFIEEFRPARALFLFDAPISQSGLLAQTYQRRMKLLGLRGAAHAVPVPERDIPYTQAVVASSDQAVLDRASKWVDLACLALAFHGSLRLTEDFSSFILNSTAYRDPPPCLWPHAID
jgi:hypothetical protein